MVESLHVSKLRFQLDGSFHFARKVLIPTVQIPEHSFLRTSLAECTPKFTQDVLTVVGAMQIDR